MIGHGACMRVRLADNGLRIGYYDKKRPRYMHE